LHFLLQKIINEKDEQTVFPVISVKIAHKNALSPIKAWFTPAGDAVTSASIRAFPPYGIHIFDTSKRMTQQ
jgi:hypothetical protein